MLRPEFKNVINEITQAMCQREPLGFRAAALLTDPAPVLTRKDETDPYTICAKFHVDGQIAGTLSGTIRMGDKVGIEAITYESEGEWIDSGLSRDLFSRFIYGLHERRAIDYIATGALAFNADMFRKLGFYRIPVNGFLPMYLSRGHTIGEIARCCSPNLPDVQSRAVLDFTDELHRRHVFRQLKLPVGALENV
jgi:hypothetical protein